MNPYNLPANTELAYPHNHQPHPYLFTSTGTMRPPIRADVPTPETNFPLAELQDRKDMIGAAMTSTTKPTRRKGGRG
jgi:hypothetical protein